MCETIQATFTNRPTFATPDDGQAEVLFKASNIAKFLADTAPHFHPGSCFDGLSVDGVEGLRWILFTLHKTIEEAAGNAEGTYSQQQRQEAKP